MNALSAFAWRVVRETVIFLHGKHKIASRSTLYSSHGRPENHPGLNLRNFRPNAVSGYLDGSFSGCLGESVPRSLGRPQVTSP